MLPRAISTHFLEKDPCTVIEELISKVSLAEGRLQHFNKGRKKEEENKDVEVTGCHGKEEKEGLDYLPG